MKTWNEYLDSSEDHPRDEHCTVHTFKFDTKQERDAFAAGIEFVNDSDVTVTPAEFPHAGRTIPGLVVMDKG